MSDEAPAAQPSATAIQVEPSDRIAPDPVLVPTMRATPRRADTVPLRLVVRRVVKSGLIGGKKFEVLARVEGGADLAALFKGYPDELVMAYRSVFADRSHSLKRSELVRGTRFQPGSLNEIIELEERLGGALDQLRRMVDIVTGGEADVVIDG